ncbi:transglutaminase-like domain-containing protein [Oceanobacillus timonensis]|uniref:transglutaminase-like domain-containing protein n=1 Tax=Oceanobacillus timonensis TaxID=1926285 RepID=UPI0009BC65C2|nr:transglutaminase family protein [Oceanobacillus timonensis]
MKLICKYNDLNAYLDESNEVDYTHPLIQDKISDLFHSSQTEIEKARAAFEFVRDSISHSWDIQSTLVTCKASEVLANGQGICYAKSNLFAALLRSQNIPTGFCYQRLMLFDTPEKGYCIHALNAIYLKSVDTWIRLDTRGNKEGIDAQFSIEEEKLAFTVQKELDEKDYPVIYTNPHSKTIATLEEHTDALEMYKHYLPGYL